MERFLFMSALVVTALVVAVPAQASVMYNSGLTEVAHGIGADFVNDTNYASLASGDLLAYTPTGDSPGDPQYGVGKINDGDFGASNTFYIPGNSPPYGTLSGSFLLTFNEGSVMVGEIEIHMGYRNRDDGVYTIKDDEGTVRGVFTITNPGLGNHATCDYFLASFDSAFETTSLTIEYVVNTDNSDSSSSICEVQVFEGVPEPATLGLLSVGGSLALLRRRRK